MGCGKEQLRDLSQHLSISLAGKAVWSAEEQPEAEEIQAQRPHGKSTAVGAKASLKISAAGKWKEIEKTMWNGVTQTQESNAAWCLLFDVLSCKLSVVE